MVRFFPNRYIPPRKVAHDVTPRQQKILEVLSKHGRLAVREIAAKMTIETRPIRDDLGLMKQLGLVNHEGHGRGAYWYLVGE